VGFGFGVGVARAGAGEEGRRKDGAGASCAKIVAIHANAVAETKRNFAPLFISGAKNSRARGIVVRGLRGSTRFSGNSRAL
jgi:hypothetical protein